MKTLVLASQNKHKIEEIQKVLSDFKILKLSDIGFTDDIDEVGSTTQENSEIKALTVLKFCKDRGLNYAVIAEDTGLFINALNGEPGIYSARYAGDHDDEANRQKVLKNLQGASDRTAYFECCFCYAKDEIVEHFVGRAYGKITTEKIGDESFGYDCIFYSDDLNKTFGEASKDEKNSVSHRARALQELKLWLGKQK